jgi:hypothetical protein
MGRPNFYKWQRHEIKSPWKEVVPWPHFFNGTAFDNIELNIDIFVTTPCWTCFCKQKEHDI